MLQTIKDVNQALVDDGLVDFDKVRAACIGHQLAQMGILNDIPALDWLRQLLLVVSVQALAVAQAEAE